MNGLKHVVAMKRIKCIGADRQARRLNLQGKTGWLAGPHLRQLLGCCHKKEMVTRPTCRMKWDVYHLGTLKSLLKVWLGFFITSMGWTFL